MALSPTDIKAYKRRLRRKGFGYSLASLLLFSKKDAAGKPCSPLASAYVNSLHCMEQWVVQDGWLTSHYCKNRWCPECNRIRTAVLINTYMPRLTEEQEAGQKLQFVTLTRRNVEKDSLKDELKEYHKIWSRITDMPQYRDFIAPEKAVEKYLQRAKKARAKAEEWQNRGFLDPKSQERVQHFLKIEKEELQKAEEWRNKRPIIGLRKLECTYHHQKYLIYRQKGGIVQYQTDICGNKKSDPYYDTYHPHFHVLCNSLEFAEWLKATWLELCGDKANEKAQDIREVYDNDTPKEDRKGKKGLLEIFKYFTKLVSKIEVPGSKDGRWFIFADQLDNIFTAMVGRRVFQRFGKDDVWQCEEVDEDNIEERAAIEGMEDDVYEFLQSGIWGDGEWAMVSHQTGDVLVSVQRKGKLCDMLRNTEETVGIDHNLLDKMAKAPPNAPPI